MNQDKNSVFLLFSLLFLIAFIHCCHHLKLTKLKSVHTVDHILNICFHNQLWFWIVFDLLDCGFNCFLGLSLIFFCCAQSIVYWTVQNYIVNWLNKELSFSTSRTNQICKKFFESSIHSPSWTRSKPYFTQLS